MPNSRHTSVMLSPSSSRPTKRRRSSITELAFHGINTSRQKAKSVTHVSGTKCHLCPRPLTMTYDFIARSGPKSVQYRGTKDPRDPRGPPAECAFCALWWLTSYFRSEHPLV